MPQKAVASSRYEVVRVIGEGGMGIVHEAIDHERRERVALKTLRNFDPDALYRFKNEFRTLAGLRHKNLVRLHELVMTEGRDVFFTMELVDGTDFRTYVSRTEIREARARLGKGSNSAPSHRPTWTVRRIGRPPCGGEAAPRHQAVERARHACGPRRAARLRRRYGALGA